MSTDRDTTQDLDTDTHKCRGCHGRGYEDLGFTTVKCVDCKGRGRVKVKEETNDSN